MTPDPNPRPIVDLLACDRVPEHFTLVTGDGQWSALYYHGDLVRYGDHDQVQDTLLDHLGVLRRHAARLTQPTSGPGDRGVPLTLAQLDDRAARAVALAAQVQALRDQADDLRDRAAQLETEAP